jgi:hypothetical protein
MSDDRLPDACARCRFFDQSNAAAAPSEYPAGHELAGTGLCRRTPPVPSPDGVGRGF